jgi:hypothetical protein
MNEKLVARGKPSDLPYDNFNESITVAENGYIETIDNSSRVIEGFNKNSEEYLFESRENIPEQLIPVSNRYIKFPVEASLSFDPKGKYMSAMQNGMITFYKLDKGYLEPTAFFRGGKCFPLNDGSAFFERDDKLFFIRDGIIREFDISVGKMCGAIASEGKYMFLSVSEGIATATFVYKEDEEDEEFSYYSSSYQVGNNLDGVKVVPHGGTHIALLQVGYGCYYFGVDGVVQSKTDWLNQLSNGMLLSDHTGEYSFYKNKICFYREVVNRTYYFDVFTTSVKTHEGRFMNGFLYFGGQELTDLLYPDSYIDATIEKEVKSIIHCEDLVYCLFDDNTMLSYVVAGRFQRYYSDELVKDETIVYNCLRPSSSHNVSLKLTFGG